MVISGSHEIRKWLTKKKGYINKSKRGNTHVLPDMIHTFFFLKNEGKSLKYIYI